MGMSKSSQQSQQQSQQTSQSQNQAYPFLQSVLGGTVDNVNKGTYALSSMLGLNGADNGKAAFDTFRGSTNYDFLKNEGINAITGNQATKGLVGSGATLKALSKYSNNLASGFLDNYLSRLLGLSETGTQAAQILSSAGNTANSQGTSFGTSSGKSSSFSLG